MKVLQSNSLIVTLDLDWACEPAIEDTLDYLQTYDIPTTVFITHRSPRVEASAQTLHIGLHPYFAPDSSHGSTIKEVVKHVMNLPHNLPAFRCHRFATCNASKQAMYEAGMVISSNVCTDLEIVPPFKDRYGLLEIPIFFEDGGYLWQKHPLEMTSSMQYMFMQKGPKVLLIHPMHFALNTPNFNYMSEIKASISRHDWNNMSKETLQRLRWKGHGIRNLIIDILRCPIPKIYLKDLTIPLLKERNHQIHLL